MEAKREREIRAALKGLTGRGRAALEAVELVADRAAAVDGSHRRARVVVNEGNTRAVVRERQRAQYGR